MSGAEYKEQAAVSLRALCRLYLTDFLCAGYALPPECEEMRTEAAEAVDEYYHLRQLAASEKVSLVLEVADILRVFLAKESMYALAFWYCLRDLRPECSVDFAHGVHWDADHPERHDHDHEEL
jgi:hypothetical protein